jgi:peptide deformylase
VKIYTVNNKKEEKFLRRPPSLFDFNKYTKKDISEIVKAMKIEMENADGIGLSANQIGLDIRVFVTKVDNKFYSIFNPKIIKKSSEMIDGEEGCLSIPGKYDEFPRPEKVTLDAYDKNGKKVKIKAWGLLARVFQHETDHLDGKLFVDYLKKK